MAEWIEAPNVNLTAHFTAREAACRHCGKIIDLDTVTDTAIWAEKIRAAMGGLPMHVSSWCRCASHNTNVGGAVGSLHMKGLAIDVTFRGLSPTQAHTSLKRLQKQGLVGGLGKYPGWVHIDRGPVRNWVGP